MATAPWFVISPNTLLSVVGLLHGPDKTVPTPTEDWRQAVVDIVIPAFKEEDNIVYCLASIRRQTKQPRNIILVDDGGKDQTIPRAKAFAESCGMNLTVIERATSIGKTPTIKRQSREFDADVEFILDGDTFLEHPNYIERCTEELFKGVGIASACGTILPMRLKDREAMAQTPDFQAYLAGEPHVDAYRQMGTASLTWWAITNMYRECLYIFLQRFVYHGQMVLFGSITNPVGCAVAYRRKYIKDLFDKYEPLFGDDLTNSEDIFIGFALNSEGYRNIQLNDVQARSEEPEVQRLPRQVYLWSSSFLQSCYYFDDLLRSPLKAPKRTYKRIRAWYTGEAKRIAELRKIQEAYRQPFGQNFTQRDGRPFGWVPFLSALEKISLPAVLIIMGLFHWWEALWVTLLAEVLLSSLILAWVTPEAPFKTFFKSLLMCPLRYGLIVQEVLTIGRFALDLWVTGNRKWRK
jgi:glycosyltransferase involved in cell wall biosynthesis